MDTNHKFFHKKDILIVLFLLILSTAIWFISNSNTSEDDLYAYIYYNNVLVKTIDLSTAENQTFSIDGKPDVVFEIKDGSIGFIESSCKDKLCIKAGFLDKDGEIAVCLPNKMVLRVESSEDENDDSLPDIISR